MSNAELQNVIGEVGAPASPTLTQDSQPTSQKMRGSGTVDDPFVVDWTGDDDDGNPLNWKTSYRYMLGGLVRALSIYLCSHRLLV